MHHQEPQKACPALYIKAVHDAVRHRHSSVTCRHVSSRTLLAARAVRKRGVQSCMVRPIPMMSTCNRARFYLLPTAVPKQVSCALLMSGVVTPCE